MTSPESVRGRLERYYDAVPRSRARAEQFGSLTLFLADGPGHPYYARPSLGYAGPVTGDDLTAVLRRQRELNVPQSLEWVQETTPSLAEVAQRAGLSVHRHPLLVHDPQAVPTGAREAPEGVAVRVLGADDPHLASAIAVPHLAFADPGTARGVAGPDELDHRSGQVDADGSVQRTAELIRSGHTVLVAALDGVRALCAGQHTPVGNTTEIVGVGTLPSARRRGLATLVTAALLADARDRGVAIVFLSADGEDVARVYARLGFRRVGTAMIAQLGPT